MVEGVDKAVDTINQSDIWRLYDSGIEDTTHLAGGDFLGSEKIAFRFNT